MPVGQHAPALRTLIIVHPCYGILMYESGERPERTNPPHRPHAAFGPSIDRTPPHRLRATVMPENPLQHDPGLIER